MGALFCGNTVSAHEMFYNSNGSAIVLKWANLQNGVPYLKINGDYLNSSYSGYFSGIVQAWPNATTMVVATQSSFSSATVDMLTPTESHWDSRYGLERFDVQGCTINKDSAGTNIENLTNAKYSTGNIVYSQVLLTPYNIFDSSTYRQKTMVHELGHVLCLGHPDDERYNPVASSVKSIMRWGSLGYKVPQQHDIVDLHNKY